MSSTRDGLAKGPFRLIATTGVEKYADCPSDHQCIVMAQYMAEFHNVLVRALNAAYEQAPQVKPGTQDAADFLWYNATICQIIHMHHDWEENDYFPAIEASAGQPGLMTSNLDQHALFEDSLAKFEAYVKQTNKEEFDGQKHCELLDKLAPDLDRHLNEEPETFFNLRHLDSAGLKKVFAVQEKIALAKSDPWRVAPLVLGCRDRSFFINGPETPQNMHIVPWFVPYLMHYVLSWRHRGAWRYNPSNFWGQPHKAAKI